MRYLRRAHKSARILFDYGTKTVEEIARILGIGRATCYRYINYAAEMREQD